MRYLLLLLGLSIFLFNCDNRRDPKLKFRVNPNTSSHYFAAYSVNYIPVDMVDIKTDTIIERDFKISIRNYTLESDAISFRSNQKLSTRRYFHRRFGAEIAVLYKNELFLDEKLSFSQFMEQPHDPFWIDATFEHTWVNQEKSSAEMLTINVSLINPAEDTYRLYELRLKSDGQKEIELIEKSA